MREPRRGRGGFTAPWWAGLVTTLAWILLGPSGALAQCASPDFKYPVALPAHGDGPRDIAFADFDRDGHLDVATADFNAGTVTVTWGKGDETWDAPTIVSVSPGVGPVALAVGDLDLNGTPDLVVAMLTSQHILPLLKDVAGRTFTPGNTLAVDNMPLDVGLGDFDRDGDLDAVTAGQSTAVQFARNDGSGTFSLGVRPVPTPPGSANALGVGDFNRDGYLDVALARGPTADVVLLLDDRSGGYITNNVFPSASGEPEDVAVGDVDRDGDLDLVLAVRNANEVNVLLGDGGGGIGGTQLFDVGGPQGGVALGDFDHDGILDVVTSAGSAFVTGVGDGTGKFANPGIWGGDPVHVAVGDVDADGSLDLGGVNPAGSVALQIGVGTAPCPLASFAGGGRLLAPLGASTYDTASGDWDGDGFADLAVAEQDQLAITFGDGRLAFGAPAIHPLPGGLTSRYLAKADFDLDSDLDLAVANDATNDVSLFENTGGTFAALPTVPTGVTPRGIVAGDFNGDGAPDLVTLDNGGPSLTFHPGRGDLTFGAPTVTPLAVNFLTAIAAADVNADLRLDVAVTNDWTHEVEWLAGDGAGGFVSLGARPSGTNPVDIRLEDVNGDTLPDTVIASNLPSNVGVLLNLGGGAFAPAVFTPVGTSPDTVRTLDANGDGRVDLVTSNFRDVTLLLGDGTGAFPTTRTFVGFQSPHALLPVDADLNGKVDLVVPNLTSPSGFPVLPGDGTGAFGPPWTSPGARSRTLASADFDRDGRTDLVVCEDNQTDIRFLKGRDDGTFEPPTLWPTALTFPWKPGIGDFDRNGTLDLVIPDRNSALVVFLAGDGAGGFAAPVGFGTGANTPSTHHLAVGDFDRDGRLDFVKLNGTADSMSIHWGDGLGNFTLPATQPVGDSPRDVVVLDFDRDGRLDLAISNFNDNTVALFQGRGNRLVPPFALVETLPTDAGPDGLATGDFDGDGVYDLLVSQSSGIPSKAGYFRGRAGAVAPPFFEPRDDYDLGGSSVAPAGIDLADVNLDGRLDALVVCRGSGVGPPPGSVRVLVGTGDPAAGLRFRPVDVWAVSQTSPNVITVADFNRDGRPDFATGESTSNPNRVAILLNSNCSARRLHPNRNVSTCDTPLSPFVMQPAIQIEDDGGNPIQCDANPVAASIIPGTGTPGAALLGTTPLPPTNGVADWALALPPLSVDLAGKKYRLEFQHPLAGLTFSRTFSQAPPIAITGPLDYCAVTGGFFSADAGFDTYHWYVDALGPVGFAPDLTLGPAAVAVGPHTVQVDAAVDTCSVTDSQPLAVYADLSSVSVAPPAPVSVCTSCTGPTLTVSETGGGALARKWGYRTTPGSGPLTFIGGETGPSYLVDGGDFPGQGTYYVVEETTPQCGVPTLSSNEVEVQVTTATSSAEEIPVFTVRSTSQLNRLEWIYPSGFGTVAIRYNTSATWAGCTPPGTVAAGMADIPDQTGPPGGKGSFDHGVLPLPPLTNGLTYCYSMFAEISSGVYSAMGRPVKGRPFDTSGPVKWAFSVGTSTLEPPGLGAGVLHVVSNDEYLYAMEKGPLGGSWPPGFTPFKSTGPSQARPASVPIAVGPASNVVYLGSQAAIGNQAIGVDAGTGLGLWGQPLGAPVQGGPGGIFTSFGGSMDAIFFGTRNGVGPSALFALDPWTGGTLPSWPYTGEPANEIGIISAQPTVDYTNDRVFLTSHHFSAGTDVVWCVDLATATRCPGWPIGATNSLNHVEASPVLRGGRLYVSPIVVSDGTLRALDADNGSNLWALPFAPVQGPIKLFVVADPFSNDLYLSTSNTVWAITDNGGSWGPKWQRPIGGPSQPVFYAGTGRVYAGSSTGRLYVLNASNGMDVVLPIPLGEPGFAVAGAPTVDQAGGYVYLGSDAGVVFAVAIP